MSKKRKKKPIDKVTTTRLDIALRMCNISIPIHLVDKIIDVVELVEDKGGKTSIKDTCRLVSIWEKHDKRQ